MANVIFKSGTRSAYDKITAKDVSTLYFCTDTGELFKGDTNMSQTNTHFEYQTTIDEEDEASTVVTVAEANIPDPKVGDVITLGAVRIGTSDQTCKKNYMYTGAGWCALESKFDAADCYFGDNIVVTNNVGRYTVDANTGRVTIQAKGKNVKELFEDIWAQVKNPTVTNPKISLTRSSGNAYYEKGAAVSLGWTITFTDGHYTYGTKANPSQNGTAGCVASNYKVTASIVDGAASTTSKTGQTGTWSGLTATNTSATGLVSILTVTPSCDYAAGTSNPLTNLGGEVSSLKIAAGSLTGSAVNMAQCYIPNFYGFKTSANLLAVDSLTSADIRALGSSQTNENATAAKTAGSAKATAAWRQFFFAIPKGRKSALAIKDANNLPLTVESTEVEVTNAGDATTTYKVFYVNLAANYSATTLTLTWTA